MAFLSLEEAANKLGLPGEALRALAKDKKIRSMLDSGKLVFKDTDIAAYLEKNPPTQQTLIPADDDLILNLGDDSSSGDSFSLGSSSSDEHPLLLDDPSQPSGDGLILDDSSENAPLLLNDPNEPSSESLVLDDSSGIGLLPDDIELSIPSGAAEQTMMLAPGNDSDSGSSDVRGVAISQTDSSSDFDLDPGMGSDSEFTLGSDALNIPSGDDSASGTGLNLDDGSSGTFMLDESSSIFELEASEAIDGGSDSNFEINLEDSSGMVEDGDFALDAEMIVDDGSDSLAGSGDDELVEEFGDAEDSDGQLVAVDEEGDVNAETVAAPSRGRARKQKLIDEEPLDIDEPESSFAEEDDEIAPKPVIAVPTAIQQPWGALPALVLLPTVIGLVLLTLMSFEILNSVIGFFNGTKTTSLILKPMMEFVDPASAKLLD
jgi:hypothetical protein